MLLYIGLGIIGILVLGAIKASYDGRIFSRSLIQRIKAMETKYDSYVDKKITIQVIDNNDLDFEIEVFTQEVMQLLKPDLDGVINLINNAYLSDIHVKYESKYFPNLISLCEEGFQLSQDNKEKKLSENDRALFSSSLQDAISADLQHRLMMLKSGNI